MDNLTLQQRSDVMARVRSKGMRPELAVRKLAYSLGYRYRLHARDLPGCPDMVFRPRRKVVFVHGCFWHRHANCKLARMPKSHVSFWRQKLEGNRRRDEEKRRELVRAGWRVLTIWECQIPKIGRVAARLQRFLNA